MDDAPRIGRLLLDAFILDDMPGWTRQALERFHERHTPDALAVSITAAALALVCENDGGIVGYASFSRPALLSMLAVAPGARRAHVGSTLLGRGVDHIERRYPEVSVIEVNASPAARPFYLSQGFFPLSRAVSISDMTFIRMGYWLGLRRLARR